MVLASVGWPRKRTNYWIAPPSHLRSVDCCDINPLTDLLALFKKASSLICDPWSSVGDVRLIEFMHGWNECLVAVGPVEDGNTG